MVQLLLKPSSLSPPSSQIMCVPGCMGSKLLLVAVFPPIFFYETLSLTPRPGFNNNPVSNPPTLMRHFKSLLPKRAKLLLLLPGSRSSKPVTPVPTTTHIVCPFRICGDISLVFTVHLYFKMNQIKFLKFNDFIRTAITEDSMKCFLFLFLCFICCIRILEQRMCVKI